MKRKVHNKLICFLFVLFVVFSLLFGGVGNAYAAEFVSGYTNVIEDLYKDKNFSIDDYPSIDKDYSLQVIQIAESTKGELFVYVYQPAALAVPLTATQINMSLSENFDEYDYSDNVSSGSSGSGSSGNDSGLSGDGNGNFGNGQGGHGGGGGSIRSVSESLSSTYLYDLTLLNRTGVFAKYKVTNFTVSVDPVRYYNISTIYRNYDKDIDTGSTEASVIEQKAFEVGKLFKAETVDGSVKYSCEKRDVVTVTDIWFGSLRYKDGSSGISWVVTKDNTDSHFVAFSTDWDMSDLYDVDISFILVPCIERDPIIKEGTPEPKFIKVDRDDIGDNTPSGWFKSKYYSWNRIQTANDFLNDKNNSLTDEARNFINGKQWVLRYYETDYIEHIVSGFLVDKEYTKVTSVTLLRFHFKSAGIVYNLGAVSDMGHSDDVPDNKPPKKTLWQYFIEFCKLLEKLTGVSYIIWAIIFLAVPVCLLFGILSIFFPVVRFALGVCFKGIWIGIKYLFIGLWWLICLPFRGIKALINKIRGE